jgi:4'-phosphopantetheinyl transferase
VGALSTEFVPAAGVPRAVDDVVDVWRADLATEADRSLLSGDEQARAARFIRAEHRRNWGTARAILRALLAGYLDTDPRALRFELGPQGKPALPAPHHDLRFNVSHSRAIALYAITRGREVGVDVEHEDRRVEAVGLARRVFGDKEAERLGALDETTRRHQFMRAWVRYEAAVKCLGTGIAGDDGAALGEHAPWVGEFDVGPGTIGAVSVVGRPPQLRYWEWSPR